MYRRLFIVAYDISCDKRRRKVRELVREFSLSAQKSVFECWLTLVDKEYLIQGVRDYLEDADLFHIFKTDQNYATYYGVSKSINAQTVIIH